MAKWCKNPVICLNLYICLLGVSCDRTIMTNNCGDTMRYIIGIMGIEWGRTNIWICSGVIKHGWEVAGSKEATYGNLPSQEWSGLLSSQGCTPHQRLNHQDRDSMTWFTGENAISLVVLGSSSLVPVCMSWIDPEVLGSILLSPAIAPDFCEVSRQLERKRHLPAGEIIFLAWVHRGYAETASKRNPEICTCRAYVSMPFQKKKRVNMGIPRTIGIFCKHVNNMQNDHLWATGSISPAQDSKCFRSRSCKASTMLAVQSQKSRCLISWSSKFHWTSWTTLW